MIAGDGGAKPQMPFDIFMIAYGEPNAAENWARLQSIAPEARRIENIRGIVACYSACAEASRTPYCFTVDADNWMLDGFRFEVPFEPRPDEIALWYADNPINGLRYAHGAIKLLPVALMKTVSMGGHVDFSTSVTRNRYTEICASEHRFNADPYSTWAGAFRECAKLAIGTTIGDALGRKLAQHRLAIWCTKGADAKFGSWCLKGAREGRRYGLEHSRDLAGLSRINDFDWLRARFRAQHVRKIVIPTRA
jgi:hypothetical protein